jgi:AraC-like DNA-binding protein
MSPDSKTGLRDHMLTESIGWDSDPTVESLTSMAAEDFARFSEIVRHTEYRAELRGPDNSVAHLCVRTASARDLSNMQIIMTAPLFGAHGTSIATLEISANDTEASGPGSARPLLSGLLQMTARAVTERIFRLRFSRFWIVAGWCPQIGKHALFAVNAEQRLVGADRGARDLFAPTQRDDNLPALGSIFMPPLPRLSNGRNETVLQRYDMDRLQWRIMITPPALGAVRIPSGNTALLHSRPRLDALANAPLFAQRPDPRGLPPRLVRHIQEYIDTHLYEPLNNKDLAIKVGFSSSHFVRAFHRAVGAPPHEYVMQRRVARAQDLLLETDSRLVDIALVTGFSDQSHFCRRFHQLTGLPPRAFRMQYRSGAST